MHRISLSTFFSIALLAFSNLAMAQGEFVPIAQVLAETSSRPYECGDYDRSTDTCTSLRTMKVSKGGVINTASFDVGPAPVVRFYSTLRYQIRNGWACADQKEMKLTADSERPQRDTSAAMTFVRKDLANMGKVCAGYFRVGKAEYEVRFRSYSGQPISGRATKVTFFARPLGLRH